MAALECQGPICIMVEDVGERSGEKKETEREREKERERERETLKPIPPCYLPVNKVHINISRPPNGFCLWPLPSRWHI